MIVKSSPVLSFPSELVFLNRRDCAFSFACCEAEGGSPYAFVVELVGLESDLFLNRVAELFIADEFKPASSLFMLPVEFKVSPMRSRFLDTYLKLFWLLRSRTPVWLSIRSCAIKFCTLLLDPVPSLFDAS